MERQTQVGTVGSLWRYPVKSMMGEELNAAEVTERRLLGDRTYALVDCADGKVATAKNPRKWPHLFDFRATFIDPESAAAHPAPVRITLPDGTMLTSLQADCDRILSRALSREVKLNSLGHSDLSSSSKTGTLYSEEYRPAGPDTGEAVADFPLPPGTFFDAASVHLLTIATLDRLAELYPRGRFEVRRFRPNIVILPASGASGFIETAWVGHTLAIGDEVRLAITAPCFRCVMTTLPQGDLPADPGILRTVAQQNHGQVGVYSTPARCGTICRGDSVRLVA